MSKINIQTVTTVIYTVFNNDQVVFVADNIEELKAYKQTVFRNIVDGMASNNNHYNAVYLQNSREVIQAAYAISDQIDTILESLE